VRRGVAVVSEVAPAGYFDSPVAKETRSILKTMRNGMVPLTKPPNSKLMDA